MKTIPKKILFVCTSGKDRSPALEKYFRAVYPMHEYRSAGVNKYFTVKHGTHYLTPEDIKWAGLIICAEFIHYQIILRDFGACGFAEKYLLSLELGEYREGQLAEDYLVNAEEKLRKYLFAGE